MSMKIMAEGSEASDHFWRAGPCCFILLQCTVFPVPAGWAASKPDLLMILTVAPRSAGREERQAC